MRAQPQGCLRRWVLGNWSERNWHAERNWKLEAAQNDLALSVEWWLQAQQLTFLFPGSSATRVAGGAHPKALPRAPRSLLSAPPGTAPAAAESDAEAEERQLVFLSWLSRTLLDSLYPGE